jgi:hypothetical protein
MLQSSLSYLLTLQKALPWEPLVGGGGLGPRVFMLVTLKMRDNFICIYLIQFVL